MTEEDRNDGGQPQQTEMFAALAEAGRDALRNLWARRDQRDSLDEREQRLLDLLQAHEEFQEYWEGREPEAGQNPFMHVFFHEILEKQLEADDPPAVRETLDRLTSGGVDEHDAKHRMLRVLVLQLHEATRDGRDLDPDTYARALSGINP
jgi:hypothetical protein